MRFKDFITTTVTKQPSIVKVWLRPYLGNYQLEDITPRQVAGLLDAVRESGATDAHVRSVLCALRSVFKEAIQQRHVFKDPTEGFKVKVRKAAVQALTAAQRDALDQVLLTSTRIAASTILRVILWTGLRISEALALRPGDYDPEAQTLRVRSGKSDAADRVVDVPDAVAYDLEAYLPFVQHHQTTLRRALSAACLAAGVPRVRVHDLRHTRITTLLMAGVPVGYVSKQAGHASAATTLDIYDQWVQVAEQEQRRRWANS